MREIGKLLLGIFYFFAILIFESNDQRPKLLFPKTVIILKCNISPKRGGHVLSNRKSSPIKSLLLKDYKWAFVKFDRWTSKGPLEKDSADFVCSFPSVCWHFHRPLSIVTLFSNCTVSIQHFCERILTWSCDTKEEVFSRTSHLHRLSFSVKKGK